MNFLKKLIFHYYPFVILGIFCIFYVVRYFDQNFILYGEEQAFLNYDYVNFRFSSIYDWSNNFGNFSFGFFSRFTAGVFWHLGYLLHVPLIYIEKLFMLTMVFIGSFFSYLAFSFRTKNRVIALLLSLVFITTYNFTIVLTTSPKLIQFVFLPIALYLFLKYEIEYNPKYIALNVLLALFTLGVGVNLPQMLGTYAFIVLYVAIFSQKKQLLRSFLFMLPLIGTLFFAFVVNYLILKNTGQFFRYDIFDISFSATASSLRDISRFFGAWWDYSGSDGIPYNHLATYYHSTVGKVVTSIPVVLYLVLLVAEKNTNKKIGFIFFFLAVLFMVKGATPPLNFAFSFFYDNFSIFKIFREPWAKFIADFIFMVYVGIAFLSSNSGRLIKILVSGLLIILLMFQTIPFIRGNIVDHRNLAYKLVDVKIPNYWLDLNAWSRKHTQDKRVLILPTDPITDTQPLYNWPEHSFRGHPEQFFLYANVVSNTSNNPQEKYILTEYFRNLSPTVLMASSIDYVLLTDMEKHKNSIGLDSIDMAIDSRNKISFGNIDVYPIKQAYIANKVRTISKVYPTDKLCDFSELNKNTQFTKNSAYVNFPYKSSVQQLSDKPVETQRLSESLYRVSFTEPSDKDVGILFAEMYNKGWRLYDSKNLFASPIVTEKNHYPANCFANFWIVNKDLVNKHHDLYIRLTAAKDFQIAKDGYYIFMTVIALFCLKQIIERRRR